MPRRIESDFYISECPDPFIEPAFWVMEYMPLPWLDFAGIYKLYRENALIYIGQSTTICKRLINHFTGSGGVTRVADLIYGFDKIEYCRVESDSMRLIWETFLIWKYKPPNNTKCQGYISGTEEIVWRRLERRFHLHHRGRKEDRENVTTIKADE